MGVSPSCRLFFASESAKQHDRENGERLKEDALCHHPVLLFTPPKIGIGDSVFQNFTVFEKSEETAHECGTRRRSEPEDQ